MGYGNTRRNVMDSLRYYFCDLQRKTVHYIDIYTYFDKELKEKVGKSRVREIVLELEQEGMIKKTDPEEIVRGRPRKQICLIPSHNNPILAIR